MDFKELWIDGNYPRLENKVKPLIVDKGDVNSVDPNPSETNELCDSLSKTIGKIYENP